MRPGCHIIFLLVLPTVYMKVGVLSCEPGNLNLINVATINCLRIPVTLFVDFYLDNEANKFELFIQSPEFALVDHLFNLINSQSLHHFFCKCISF